jgi:large subunit ribosomal protein L21
LTYAIIKVAGKQYRVREGEKLLVDRLAEKDGATFSPTVLLVGGSGNETPALDPGITVTAKVLGEVKGPKIRIGKYKKRTGYRRHTGFRASLTQIEIEQIGTTKRRAKMRAEAAAETKKAAPPADAAPATESKLQKRAPQPQKASMPSGYEDMTVAQIKEASSDWNRPMLEAALEYEQGHANRKGAIAVIESALAHKEGDS